MYWNRSTLRDFLPLLYFSYNAVGMYAWCGMYLWHIICSKQSCLRYFFSEPCGHAMTTIRSFSLFVIEMEWFLFRRLFILNYWKNLFGSTLLPDSLRYCPDDIFLHKFGWKYVCSPSFSIKVGRINKREGMDDDTHTILYITTLEMRLVISLEKSFLFFWEKLFYKISMKKFELCPAFLSSSTTLVHATNIMYIVWFLSSLV